MKESLEFTAALAMMKERTDGIANSPRNARPGNESGLREAGSGGSRRPCERCKRRKTARPKGRRETDGGGGGGRGRRKAQTAKPHDTTTTTTSG